MRSFIIIAHYFNSISTILNRKRRRWEIIDDSRFLRAHKRGSDIGVATACYLIYDININHEDFTVAVFSRRMLTHVTALHDVSYEIITATDVSVLSAVAYDSHFVSARRRWSSAGHYFRGAPLHCGNPIAATTCCTS